MKTSAATLANAALAAALLALAPGRATAAAPYVFVSVEGTANVPAFDAYGSAATGYTVPTSPTYPAGVAYDPANNTLYVADLGTNQILTYNAATGAPVSIGFGRSAGLNEPEGLAFSNGVIYAANLNNNTITAYNAATGQPVTSGFVAPTGLINPDSLAVNGTTLYVNSGNTTLAAYNLTTGAALATFTAPTGLQGARGLALSGNDLFVSNFGANQVSEYNATTGAAIAQFFIVDVRGPEGLAVQGNILFVVNSTSGTANEYGIPAVAMPNNEPTRESDGYITGLSSPDFIAVVPEPSTWALVGLGMAGLALAARRRRVRAA